MERVRALAKDLVDLKPDVLVSRSTPATMALRSETDAIPIVFVNIAEPVESGLAQTLARPGGNVTGFTNFESSIGGKWLQLLKEVDPQISRVGMIYNPQTAPFAGLFLRSVQSAAPHARRSSGRPTGRYACGHRDGAGGIWARERGQSGRDPRQLHGRASPPHHRARGAIPPAGGLFLPSPQRAAAA